MAFYGTYVLARSATPLPHVPGMRSAFGSRCMLITRHQEGWQLAGLMTPMHHEWPAIHGGPVPLAIATGAPVLAVEIKESYCLQYGGATPDGRLWLAHFARAADNDKGCIFDHHDDSTVPLPAGDDVPANDLPGLADHLAGWAADAGLDTTAPRIAEAIGTRTNETALDGLVRALGLVPVDTVYPAVELDDLDWWECWQRADDASVRVIQEWNARKRGRLRPLPGRPPAGADEFIRFLDRVADSMFGGGLTRAELRAEAARLLKTYPQP
ncbi:hypothetical protein ACQEVZ_06290 [Dactylosporangium sp. CA-152071]|uniref:hypothetical protein n=1 Tax=Dactylosporangium sp. CA-152071 TaxID=3239933 RepID=UPI003D947C55